LIQGWRLSLEIGINPMVEIKSFKLAWIAKCEDIYIKGDEVDSGDLFFKEIYR